MHGTCNSGDLERIGRIYAIQQLSRDTNWKTLLKVTLAILRLASLYM